MAATVPTRMPYGLSYLYLITPRMLLTFLDIVRLGKSGLKVSKIILGCMSYGSPEWQPWLLGEEEGIKHIKFA